VRSVLQHGWLMRMFPAAAGAVASAMAAESRGKLKIRGAARRGPCGTDSAAGGESGTALGSPASLLHSLLAAATGSPRSMRHRHLSTRKPVSERRQHRLLHRGQDNGGAAG